MEEKIFKIYNQEAIEFLSKMRDNEIDCIITDPPYLINYDHWDSNDFKWHEKWLEQCHRVLKEGGTIWSFMAYTDKLGKKYLGYEFYNLMNKFFECDLRNTIIWARQKGRGSSKHLKSMREDIYYGYKNGSKPVWNNLKVLREVICPYVKDGRPRGWFLDENGKRVRWTGLGNVWVYSSPQWNHKTEKQFHSAQKPVMLIERLIRLSSNEGDTILDPFMGSGTTGIACLLSGRKFIGVEYEKEYFKIADKRLNEFNKEQYVEYN